MNTDKVNMRAEIMEAGLALAKMKEQTFCKQIILSDDVVHDMPLACAELEKYAGRLRKVCI